MCQIFEADLLQVAKVMGLESQIDVTDDIGNANAILALSSEMKQNPWIRSVAKFHQLPVFVIKVGLKCSLIFILPIIEITGDPCLNVVNLENLMACSSSDYEIENKKRGKGGA